jgi:uncharacterized protein (UPF0332 family)
MDAQRQQELWANAIENFQAARQMARQGRHNDSVACCYYPVFTAMWIALGDPPRGPWSHGGIFQHFAPGQWRQPQTPLDRTVINGVRILYNARLKAHYKAVRLTATESAESLTMARQILQLVASVLGLPQGGSTP